MTLFEGLKIRFVVSKGKLAIDTYVFICYNEYRRIINSACREFFLKGDYKSIPSSTWKLQKVSKLTRG
jgi:hypothetical protein